MSSLFGREQVEVPLAAGPVVVGRATPCRAGEVGDPFGRRQVAVRAAPRMEPEPGALRRTGPGGEGRLEPGVTVGDVIGHDVDERPDAKGQGFGDERFGLLEGAEGWIDRSVVGHVVAAIGEGRDIPRREPDGVDPEVAQVGEAGTHAREVAGAVAVAVGEAADVDLVDDRVAPPGGVVGHAGLGGAVAGDAGDGRFGHCGSFERFGGSSGPRPQRARVARQRSASYGIMQELDKRLSNE